MTGGDPVTRYLSRLGFSAAPEPTVASLGDLHRRHTASGATMG